MEFSLETEKNVIRKCVNFVDKYKFLTCDALIIEFFNESLWNRLPASWRISLDSISPKKLYQIIEDEDQLSLADKELCFPQNFKELLLIRKHLLLPKKYKETHNQKLPEKMMLKQSACHRHVGPKKEHEICHLAPIIAATYARTDCRKIYDFGSGQGHLSRRLSVVYDLPNVMGVERNTQFTKRAEKFDNETQQTLKNYKLFFPKHANKNINTKLKSNHIVDEVCSDDSDVLLTGLHACGDLSSTMVRIFCEDHRIKSLVSVACCYHRLTMLPDHTEQRSGYPMSNLVRNMPNHALEYCSLRIACHSTELFLNELKKGDEGKLRVYCYRAVLQYILKNQHPELIRPNVDGIKNAHNMNFQQYLEAASIKLKLAKLPEYNTEEVNKMLGKWKNVVTFFALGVILGPVIESLILRDRCQYLFENGLQPQISSIFNPNLSPRSYVIVCSKN